MPAIDRPERTESGPCCLSLACLQDAYDQKGVIALAESKLKEYETLYIVRPNLDEEGVDRTVNAVEEYMKGLGAVIESTEKKGRRRLAYEVKKMRDGYYVLTFFKAKTESLAQIKRWMSLSEDIIRFIIVVREKESVGSLL